MTTQHWLVKQEPEAYAWTDFVRDGKTNWEGVRNFQARNFLKAMAVGDAVLRKGNSAGYPARLEPKLPRGVEARKLGERGGWVQVRLAGGAVGWLPASAVMNLGERDQ